MFSAAFLPIAKVRRQPKYLSVDEWIEKMIQPKNSIPYYHTHPSFATTWIDLRALW